MTSHLLSRNLTFSCLLNSSIQPCEARSSILIDTSISGLNASSSLISVEIDGVDAMTAHVERPLACTVISP